MTQKTWNTADPLLLLAQRAKAASRILSQASSEVKNEALWQIAEHLRENEKLILETNAEEVELARKAGKNEAFLDRLTLTPARLQAMVDGIAQVIALEDPVGRHLETAIRPNGLKIEKVAVPLGVLFIVFEARPTVTIDAAVLSIKAGNAVILRSGHECVKTTQVMIALMQHAMEHAKLPPAIVQGVPSAGREDFLPLLKMNAWIDVVIPRGGESLIQTVMQHATVPVLKHYKGVCHLYVDDFADFDMALEVIINGKCQRPAVCNALEKVLVSEKIAEAFVPMLTAALVAHSVEIRADEAYRTYSPEVKPAAESDFSAEYLDLILTAAVVPDLETAIDHINTYGSHHSDCIITQDENRAKRFLHQVDSAVVYWNASTRFTDGFEFGFGAEIGISTDKLHARGPMGLKELTTYQYRVIGNGQIRS